MDGAHRTATARHDAAPMPGQTSTSREITGTIIDLREHILRPSGRPRVSAVIPTLNEAKNLPHVLPAIPKIVDEVIIVDGASTDGTIEVARALRPDAVIITELQPGKGHALRTGLLAATGDFIVALDADGSTDPREIPAFVGALDAGADLVKGSRFMQGGGTADMEFHRKCGNGALRSVVNMLFAARYSDLCYGYFALRRSALAALFRDDDVVAEFEIETFVNVRALQVGLHVTEVASFEHRRIHGESNLQAMRTGFRILRVIASERFAGVPGDRRRRLAWRRDIATDQRERNLAHLVPAEEA